MIQENFYLKNLKNVNSFSKHPSELVEVSTQAEITFTTISIEKSMQTEKMDEINEYIQSKPRLCHIETQTDETLQNLDDKVKSDKKTETNSLSSMQENFSFPRKSDEQNIFFPEIIKQNLSKRKMEDGKSLTSCEGIISKQLQNEEDFRRSLPGNLQSKTKWDLQERKNVERLVSTQNTIDDHFPTKLDRISFPLKGSPPPSPQPENNGEGSSWKRKWKMSDGFPRKKRLVSVEMQTDAEIVIYGPTDVSQVLLFSSEAKKQLPALLLAEKKRLEAENLREVERNRVLELEKKINELEVLEPTNVENIDETSILLDQKNAEISQLKSFYEDKLKAYSHLCDSFEAQCTFASSKVDDLTMMLAKKMDQYSCLGTRGDAGQVHTNPFTSRDSSDSDQIQLD